TSEMILPLDSVRRVPPTASTHGLEAGKSTWARPSVTPSVTPLSPAAVTTVMPCFAAGCNASFICFILVNAQVLSGEPQEIVRIDGRLVLSATAALTASRKP